MIPEGRPAFRPVASLIVPRPDLSSMPQVTEDPLLGQPAPAFCLPDAGKKTVCLEQFRGTWVVLYFYPKDNTAGCTLEAVQFTAALEEFAALGARVIGISGDTPESHRNFAARHNLTILLLSDTGHTVLAAYGSWNLKKMYGKDYFGTTRDTFLIDPAGTGVAVMRSRACA